MLLWIFDFCKSMLQKHFQKAKQAVSTSFQYFTYFQCIFNAICVNSANLISNTLRHLPGTFLASRVSDRSLSDQQRLSLPFLQGLPRNLHLQKIIWHIENANPKRSFIFLPMLRACLAHSDCTAFSDNCFGDFTTSLLHSSHRKTCSPKTVETDSRPSSTQTGFDPHLLQSWGSMLSGERTFHLSSRVSITLEAEQDPTRQSL